MEYNTVKVFDFTGKNILEISADLRTECGNNCKFCIDKVCDLKDTIYITSQMIHEMADNTLEYFMSDRAQEVGKIKFSVLGGELFESSVTEERWNDYYYFFDTCIENAKKAYIDIYFYITTNLIYPVENLKRVFELLDYLNNKVPGICNSIGTSFDVWGRFHTKESLKLWRINFEYFLKEMQKRNIEVCSETVLTKPAIEILKNRPKEYKEELEIFDFLRKLTKEGIIKHNLNRFWGPTKPEFVNDKELAEFIKWALDKYPELELIGKFLDTEKPHRSCHGGSGEFINNKVQENGCNVIESIASIAINMDMSKKDALEKMLMAVPKKDNEITYSFDGIFKEFMKYNRCSLCKHFKYCCFDCMNLWNLKASHHDIESHYCWLKDVYNYAEELKNDKTK